MLNEIPSCNLNGKYFLSENKSFTEILTALSFDKVF